MDAVHQYQDNGTDKHYPISLAYQPWYSVFLSQQISKPYFSVWLFSETTRAPIINLSIFACLEMNIEN
jgi:hypothetical protein